MLSRRETEIARAYASGRDHKDIADRLCISPATVRTHLANIYKKLGVSTKIDLLRMLGPDPADPAGPRSRPSIAVLPFVDRSPDPHDDFLAYGISEGITSELSRFRDLFVISHASSIGYRNSAKEVSAIAGELGARYVVAGSVARSADRVRVIAELLDARSGALVWSQRFDRVITDLFELQDDLVRAISAAFVPEIEAKEKEKTRSQHPDNLGAWELYCRASLEFFAMTEESFARARLLCDRAIALEPGFAKPHALLSQCHFYELISGRARDWRRSLADGLDHARRALAIDGRDDVAYSVLGYNLAASRRWTEAFAALERGFEINANSSNLHHARATATLIFPEGDLARARRDEQMAITLSPSDPWRWTHFAITGLIELSDDATGDAGAAREAFLRSAAMPHADWQAHVGLTMAALAQEDDPAARVYAETAARRLPGLSVRRVRHAFAPLIARSPQFAALVARLEADGLLAV